MPRTGRGIQGATSHCLGQNFAKMFNIEIERIEGYVAEEGNHDGDFKDGKHQYVWQNSWGLTTRVIGVMVMVHGDDKGLVLPPRIASVQVVIVPCGITVKMTPAEKEAVLSACAQTAAALTAAGVRVKLDDRTNSSPGWKVLLIDSSSLSFCPLLITLPFLYFLSSRIGRSRVCLCALRWDPRTSKRAR